MTRSIATRITLASLLGAALLALLAVVTYRVQPPVGLVPLLTVQGRPFWLAAIAVCLVGAAVFQVLDPMPQIATTTAAQRGIRYDPVPEWPTGWGLPFTTLAAGALVLSAYHSALAGLAVTFFGFIALLVGELA
ncbi:MAG: hypothetical protein RMJ05_02700, partial [Thermomicrobium sp.]|nr:hypothetical protein [Thermomicrobium sp.]MDW8005609.1 hypothetical protein [Thermomicrobium sp.]